MLFLVYTYEAGDCLRSNYLRNAEADAEPAEEIRQRIFFV
jgi:hypothetical protein